MSNPENLTPNTIKLFRTGDHDCSYLPDRQSRTLFLDPELKFGVNLYEELTHSGFRRSGNHLYRPDCKECQSCIPSRIPLEHFKLKRRFKRVLSKNKDVTLQVSNDSFRQDDYDLFERYIEERHSDGDMYPASETGYKDFLAGDKPFSFHIRYFLGDTLIGVAVTDRLNSGLSSIYTFFDPDLDSRSLGVFSVLKQIELAESFNLPYLYLGYWVPGCRKMQYKTQYEPIELLIDAQWQRIKHD